MARVPAIAAVSIRGLAEAIVAHDWIEADPDELAGAIVTELRKAGLAIHREADCVRPGPPPGREMTPEEIETLMGGTV